MMGFKKGQHVKIFNSNWSHGYILMTSPDGRFAKVSAFTQHGHKAHDVWFPKTDLVLFPKE